MRLNQKNGKIQINLCEINVVHHCNLTCRRCSHLSPAAKEYFIQPEQVYKDLSILAKYCQPQHIRLLGGEPLLHPGLLNVIEAVTESGISECIRVDTNGILLEHMPELFWQKVDQIKVSLYPGCRISPRQLSLYRRHAKKFGVKLIVDYITRFREAYSERGTADRELTQRIFSTCQVTHTWGCFTIHEGYFYRCSLSMLIPLYLQGVPDKDIKEDGLKLEISPVFFHKLQHYLLTDEPLRACSFCLGSVGKRFFPKQESPSFEARFTSERLLDRRYLKFYEIFGNRSISPQLLYLAAPLKTALSRWERVLKK